MMCDRKMPNVFKTILNWRTYNEYPACASRVSGVGPTHSAHAWRPSSVYTHASSSAHIFFTLSPCVVESHPTPGGMPWQLLSIDPALYLASRLMFLVVAPLAYPLSVSSHLCLGLPLFLAPFILPSITSSSIPPALTTCPKQPLSPLTPVSIPV